MRVGIVALCKLAFVGLKTPQPLRRRDFVCPAGLEAALQSDNAASSGLLARESLNAAEAFFRVA